MTSDKIKAYTLWYGRGDFVKHFLHKKVIEDYITNTKDAFSRSMYRIEPRSVAPEGQSFTTRGQISFDEYQKLVKRTAAAKEAMQKLSPEVCELLDIHPL